MDKRRYNRIKAELAEAGKQSKDLAKHMNVHVTTISDWCTNTNQPSLQDLYKVAAFLGIDARRLLVPGAPGHVANAALQTAVAPATSYSRQQIHNKRKNRSRA